MGDITSQRRHAAFGEQGSFFEHFLSKNDFCSYPDHIGHLIVTLLFSLLYHNPRYLDTLMEAAKQEWKDEVFPVDF